MKRFYTVYLLIIFLIVNAGIGFSQQIKPFTYGPEDAYDKNVATPESVLGYKIGEHFTPHYKLVDYLQTVTETSPRVLLHKYGETYEGRPLYILIISAQDNLNSFETIRTRLSKKA